MDTPSTTPNADAPYIQCARAIDLTPAQVALLQEAFADKTKLMVEQRFNGYSGASLYLITCDGQAPVVVKLDHPYHIRQEYAAYQQFVKSQLGLIAARIEQAPVIQERHQMGLLVYTFMGRDPAQPASSLFDYYQQQGGKATVAMLHLIFDYGKHWWSYHSPKRIFPYEEYDWLLPADVQLQVSAAHLPEDQLLQAQAINLAMLRQLQPEQAVRLEGFQVIKVRPAALTLSTPAPPGLLPAPPYLRLVGQLDTAYQPGELLASQVARVEATQFMRLAAYAAHSLPTLDPKQDYFLLEGRRYRNPLAALPELLDQPYETNYSIIHGDLNLQNIMVMAQREQHVRFAWLIDFAQTRRGPTLLDLQRLEVQIITKLLPVNLKPAQLITLLEALHTKSPDTRSPLPALQEPYLVLAALRRLLPKYMFDHDHWGEYYRGLALVLLGALKFEELADVARQRALLAAAIVLDLAEKPSLPPAHPWREWVRHAVSALLLLVILLLPSASQSVQSLPGRAFPEAEVLFHRDPRWLGTGTALSVPLAVDRALWLFGDTFIATSQAHTRAEAKLVRNTIAIQRGADPRTAAITFHERQSSDGSPASFFPEKGDRWYWPGQGIRLKEGPLVIFLYAMIAKPSQDSGFNFANVGYAVAIIDNPDTSAALWRPRIVDRPPMAFDAVPARAVVQDGAYIVALAIRQEGTHAGALVRYPEDRLAKGDMASAEWWAGAERGWVPEAALGAGGPTFVLDDAGNECSLHWDARTGSFIHIASYGFGASTIGMRTAPTLTGPWSAPVTIYRPPESDGPNPFVYGAKAHPELVGPGAADLVVTYITNSFTFDDLFTWQGERSLYWPRFVLVRIGK